MQMHRENNSSINPHSRKCTRDVQDIQINPSTVAEARRIVRHERLKRSALVKHSERKIERAMFLASGERIEGVEGGGEGGRF